MATATTPRKIRNAHEANHIITIAIFSIIALAMVLFLVILLYQWYMRPEPFTTVAQVTNLYTTLPGLA